MPNLPKTKENLQEFLSNYSPKQIRNALESFPLGWFLVHKIKTSSGLPFEFKKRRFLRAIINDLSPKQAWLKPPQIGASEGIFVKLFFVAEKLRKFIIYTLPTLTDVQDMVGGKFNPIIAQNTKLQQLTKDHDTIVQKKIGDVVLYLRGTKGETQAMMVSSGLNVHDEIDASDLNTITQYENRQEAQEREEDKWRWVFSHPSLKGMGVDIYWEKSDKKEWVITCPHCQQMQVLTWPNSISQELQEFICKACKGILPDESRITGDWYNQDLVKWTGKVVGNYEYSGWHASQLMLHNKTAKDIIRAYNDPLKDKQFFYNYVLGLPYQGGDDQITSEQVLKNCVPEVNEQKGKIIIGVDPGLPVYYVCMNEQGLFYFNTCQPPSEKDDGYEDIRRLMRKWPNAIVITDQGGDLTPMRKMQADFPGRVFLAFYRKDRKSDALWKWGEGDEYGTVVIDRNRTMQLVVEELKEGGRWKLNGTPEEFKEYADHFANMYREKVVVKDVKDKDDRSLYGAEYVWKRRGADHWAHASLYARVGYEKYGQSMAKINAPDVLSTLKEGLTDNQFTGSVILRSISDDSINF